MMAYVDEGDGDARPVLLLHGNPTWGFRYRDFIGPLTAAGYRAIVPDWIGAGCSDKPRVDAGLTTAHPHHRPSSRPLAMMVMPAEPCPPRCFNCAIEYASSEGIPA